MKITKQYRPSALLDNKTSSYKAEFEVNMIKWSWLDASWYHEVITKGNSANPVCSLAQDIAHAFGVFNYKLDTLTERRFNKFYPDVWF